MRRKQDLAQTVLNGEDAMRAGMAAALAEDKSGMLAKFKDLSQDEAAIAIALAQRVVLDVLDMARPDGMTADDYADLSAEIAKDTFAGYDAATIRTFLEELVTGQEQTADNIDVAYLLILSACFLVTGHTDEDEEWEDYLDELEEQILLTGGGDTPTALHPR